MGAKYPQKPSLQAQSLPPTPTAVRTFTDFSQEHTRLTTLHGSTGALEVNGLGGFYGQMKQGGYNPTAMPPSGSFRPPFEPGANGAYPHKPLGYGYTDLHTGEGGGNGCIEEDLNDVFTNLTLTEPYMPGYSHGRSRRSSAPVHPGGNLWNSDIPMGMPNGFSYLPSNHTQWSAPPPNNPPASQSVHGSVSSIWSPTLTSPPESEISSFQDSDGSQSFNGFSPVYSPIAGNFDEAVTTAATTGTSLIVAMTTAASTIAASHKNSDSPLPVSVVQTSLGGTMTTDSKVRTEREKEREREKECG